MSYILDALRKADAQRQRDPARGIHAQPLRGAGGHPAPRSSYGWLWGVAALGLAALASAGWYLYRDHGEPASRNGRAATVAADSGMAGPAAGAPAPVVGNAAAPAAIAALPPVPAPGRRVEPPPIATQPGMGPPLRDPRASSLPTMRGGPQLGGPTTAPAPANPSALAVPVPMPANQAAAPGVNSPAPSAAAPAPVGAPAMAGAPSAAGAPAPVGAVSAAPFAATPAPAATNTSTASGLPADAPKLAISGGVYSTSPAQRMLIVNGQVFNEGSEIGPGVIVEEIKARSAVLRFRGTRYTVAY